MDLAKMVMVLPSLSVIVFLRTRIGYRLLDSGWYLGVALVVFLIGTFNIDPSSPFPHAMEWYAGAIAVMGATHRMIAWSQLRRGTQPHSYSSGVSWLGLRLLPKFLRQGGTPNWLLDPLATAITGLIVSEKLSPAFGGWLLVAAVSTLFLEIILSVKSADRDMDVADGLIMAEVQSDSAKRFGGGAGSEESDGGAVISTGLGADLRQRIKTRRTGKP